VPEYDAGEAGEFGLGDWLLVLVSGGPIVVWFLWLVASQGAG
jgi:hypothetical protein